MATAAGGEGRKGRAPRPEDGGPAEEARTPNAPGTRPGLLDHYLGTKEGRARLLVIFWIISLAFLGLGYGLMFWIFFGR